MRGKRPDCSSSVNNVRNMQNLLHIRGMNILGKGSITSFWLTVVNKSKKPSKDSKKRSP